MQRGCSRPIAVVALVVVGCLVVAAANLAIWARREVLDEDHFVSALAPLASDEDLIDSVADELTDRIARIAPSVPRDLADDALREVLSSPAFKTIWVDALREAHHELLLLVDEGHQNVGLDLDEVLKRVRSVLERHGINVLDDFAIEEIDDIVPWRSDYLRTVIRVVDIDKRLTVLLPPLALGLFAAAVVISDHRRRTVGRIGAGVAVLMLLTAAATWIERGRAMDRIRHDAVRRAAGDIWDGVVTTLHRQTFGLFVVGVLVALGAWMLGRRRGLR